MRSLCLNELFQISGGADAAQLVQAVSKIPNPPGTPSNFVTVNFDCSVHYAIPVPRILPGPSIYYGMIHSGTRFSGVDNNGDGYPDDFLNAWGMLIIIEMICS